MRNILVVQEAYVRGGSDYIIVDLVRNWPAGATFTVMVNSTHPAPHVFRDAGANVVRYSSLRERFSSGTRPEDAEDAALAALADATRLLHEQRPDVIVLNNGGFPGGSSHFFMMLTALAKDIPRRLMIVHNLSPTRPTHSAAFLAATTLDVVVTVTEHLRRHVGGLIGDERVVTIHNGVRDTTSPVRPPRVITSPVRLGILGSVEERKGHEVCLRALDRVRRSGLQADLAIRGDYSADARGRLTALARELGVASHVSWSPHTEDLEALYADLDVVAIPSLRQESCSRVALEAMCRSIPLIVSDCEGLPEIVEAGVTGWVVPAGDADAFARAITDVGRRPQEGGARASRGRRRYVQRFRLEDMVRNYSRLLMDA